MSAYIHNIFYELGEEAPISSLPEVLENESLYEILDNEGNGFKNYLFYEESVFEFAESLLKKYLKQNNIDPLQIDLVIFASDSFSDLPGKMKKLGALLNENNLINAYPLSIGFSECSNLHMAISIANAFVNQEIYSNILIVSLDLASIISPISRIVMPGIAVMSDAASCCLVSKNSDFEKWKILCTSQKTHPLLLQRKLLRKDELALRMKSHLELFDELFKTYNKVTKNDIAKVLSSNFLPSVLSVLLTSCGFENNQLFFDGIAKYGHCLGSDCLINLKDYSNSGMLKDREKVILYGEGPSQWGAIMLEYYLT